MTIVLKLLIVFQDRVEKSTLLCYNVEELEVILCQKLIMYVDMKIKRQLIDWYRFIAHFQKNIIKVFKRFITYMFLIKNKKREKMVYFD